MRRLVRGLTAAIVVFVTLASASIAAAGTEFLKYQGRDAIQVGQGGSSKVVDGIDFWIDGTPPRRFQVLGTISDERHKTGLIGVIAMSGLEHDVAKLAHEAGADAVILSGAQDNVEGYVGSTGSTAYVRPIESHASRYLVIKYLPDDRPTDGVPSTSSSGLAPPASSSIASVGTESRVALERNNGVLTVPVTINGAIQLRFMVDSGASDVTIPADVFMTLTRTGTIDASDYIGKQVYVLADGSTVPSTTFRIRKLKIGDREVTDVKASIADPRGPLLLGQSFLSRFRTWSVDNAGQVLVLGASQ